MIDIEWAMVHYDGNNDEPYADLVVDALRQKREVDALAAEYGIDAKTMLTLARSQIKTTQSNIELSEKLEAAIEDLHTLRTKQVSVMGVYSIIMTQQIVRTKNTKLLVIQHQKTISGNGVN